MDPPIAEVTKDERVRSDAEEAMRKLLDGTTDAIAVHREGKLVYANPAGLKLLGYAGPEEVIGRPVLDFVAPPLRDVVAKRIFKGYAGGGNAAHQRAPGEGEAEHDLRPIGDAFHERIDHDHKQRGETA